MTTPQLDTPVDYWPRPESAKPVHQPRERRRPCTGCRHDTLNVHGVCAACHAGNGWQHERGTCARCKDQPTHIIWPPVFDNAGVTA